MSVPCVANNFLVSEVGRTDPDGKYIYTDAGSRAEGIVLQCVERESIASALQQTAQQYCPAVLEDLYPCCSRLGRIYVCLLNGSVFKA